MNTLFGDVRYTFRTLSKAPGFAAAIIISIALGIAANATIFSVDNGLLRGTLPGGGPGRLGRFNEGR